ncbi:MAG: flippase-like domain-containing protein [Chloroflexi bacterium]|nr:MAG: hypothetical protein UZ13_02412 [Chloroflexi bacterium OLB13]MBC6955391.1 UPF0104 family protein [Chloroflexota bacterium]MBV6435425.1 hypothetical protein [Anaerolineae bacterium]MDL1915283.1 flippase-like domain-containing protein [Anaerolineae bacterium CFX4]OQY86485.1 MAG: hypothetical protein B6D42_01120 [Anaerolineae bacterium UTCFX5]
MRRYRNQIIIGLLISLALYIAVLIVFDNQGQFTEGVVQAFDGFPWIALLWIALAQTGTFVFRFFTWQYYMGVIGARERMSVLDSAVIFVVGFVLVVSPGKAAELLKAVLVKVKSGTPTARTVPVVVAERVVDGISVIILLAVAMFAAEEQLQLGEYRDFSRAIVFSSAGLILFGLLAVQVRPLGELILAIIARIPLIRRTSHWFRELYESSRTVFSLRHVLVTMMFGVGVYAFTALAFVVILVAFGLPLTLTLVLQAAFIVGVSTAIGALSFVPNGAGVTEISQAAMLMAIVAPQNPELTVGVAAAAALLEGFFHKWYRVLVGLGTAFVYRQRLFSPAVERELELARLRGSHADQSRSAAS